MRLLEFLSAGIRRRRPRGRAMLRSACGAVVEELSPAPFPPAPRGGGGAAAGKKQLPSAAPLFFHNLLDR